MIDASTIATCLRGGGVAVLPTDTVYGLAAAPMSEAAVTRLFALKDRPRTRALPIMVSTRDQVAALGAVFTDAAERLLASGLMPGALTLVLGVNAAAAPAWLEGREEIAVRLPDHALMLAVLRLTGPLLVTSANAHGLATPESLNDVLRQLHGMPDIAVDGGVLSAVPSTLVNCRTSPPVIERAGAIADTLIWEALA